VRLEGLRQHVRLHHHPRPAAEGRVVDGLVDVVGEGARVDRFKRPQLFLQRLAGEAEAEVPREHLGEEGEEFDVERAHA